jgi:hypothetical protein
MFPRPTLSLESRQPKLECVPPVSCLVYRLCELWTVYGVFSFYRELGFTVAGPVLSSSLFSGLAPQ